MTGACWFRPVLLPDGSRHTYILESQDGCALAICAPLEPELDAIVADVLAAAGMLHVSDDGAELDVGEE